MPKNNSKVREISKKEASEIFDTTCEKYLNMTVKINNLHALSKYLFWINNYYQERVYKVWDGDMERPEVQILIDQLTNYARHFIRLGYIKYFSDFSITAYHWSDSVSSEGKYQKGDFSGMVMRIKGSDTNPDDYFELSVATPYLKKADCRNRYHKLAQYVNHASKDNSLSDINRLDTHDLAYLFLPAGLATVVEDKIIEILKESDDLKCWIILQTGYQF